MTLQNTVTVATSLVPANIEQQIKNINSWVKLGLKVISVNSDKEIKFLESYFPLVQFVEVYRDASNMAGKPFVYLDDVLQILEKTEGQVCGLINSDIFLSGSSDLLNDIIEKSQNGFVFGSRIDVDSLDDRHGEEYFGGFDYFFFDKTVIPHYQKTDFCLGLPWWDFWLPLVPMIQGLPVRRLITPFAYHAKHQQNWQQPFFETFGRIVAEYLKQQNQLKNLDKELKACFSCIDEPEIINFCKCILSYLKNVPERLYYPKADQWAMSYTNSGIARESIRGALFESEETMPSQKKVISGVVSTKQQLRVAFFTSHPANVGSGAERLIYQTAKALIERGHDARVYVMQAHLDKNPPFFVHQMPRVPLERLFERGQARLTGWNDFFFPSTAILPFRRWLRTADIWHFHNLHGHYVSIPLLSMASRAKRIVLSPVDKYLSTGYCPYPMDCERYLTGCGACERLHEPWPGISRDATKILWKMKRFFIPHSRFHMLFHTQALADHYHKTFVAHRPGSVIHYGIDVNCFRQLNQADCLRKFSLEKTSKFVVGLFHSYLLEQRKGILPLVKRLGESAKQRPGNMELLVVGNGGHAVKDIVPPELSVTVLPYLRHPHELAGALNLCDVLLYPTEAENLSLTCLYALACGVPVISYNAGGQKEAVSNGHNGFIVEIGDEDGMINKVMEMIKNPDLKRRLSDGARHTAETEYDFERYIDDLIEYYGGVMK